MRQARSDVGGDDDAAAARGGGRGSCNCWLGSHLRRRELGLCPHVGRGVEVVVAVLEVDGADRGPVEHLLSEVLAAGAVGVLPEARERLADDRVVRLLDALQCSAVGRQWTAWRHGVGTGNRDDTTGTARLLSPSSAAGAGGSPAHRRLVVEPREEPLDEALHALHGVVLLDGRQEEVGVHQRVGHALQEGPGLQEEGGDCHAGEVLPRHEGGDCRPEQNNTARHDDDVEGEQGGEGKVRGTRVAAAMPREVAGGAAARNAARCAEFALRGRFCGCRPRRDAPRWPRTEGCSGSTSSFRPPSVLEASGTARSYSWSGVGSPPAAAAAVPAPPVADIFGGARGRERAPGALTRDAGDNSEAEFACSWGVGCV